jgi:hypothetical protein
LAQAAQIRHHAPVFQLILPFQLELPFEAPAEVRPAGSFRAPRMARSKHTRGERSRAIASHSLELELGAREVEL